MSEKICSKPGCGAQCLIGNPCTDWDCPQRTMTAAQHREVVEGLGVVDERDIAKLKTAVDSVNELFAGMLAKYGKSIRLMAHVNYRDEFGDQITRLMVDISTGRVVLGESK